MTLNETFQPAPGFDGAQAELCGSLTASSRASPANLVLKG